jgi:hypothetical protein
MKRLKTISQNLNRLMQYFLRMKLSYLEEANCSRFPDEFSPEKAYFQE